MTSHTIRAGGIALALLLSACSGGDGDQSASESAVAEATTSTTAAPSTTTQAPTTTTVAPTTTTEAPAPLPAWVEALPIDVAANDLAPEALAFADGFVDPGGHYRLSIGPEWELIGSGGIEQAPITEWRFGELGMRITSLPTNGVPLAESVAGFQGTPLYVDDERAVVSQVVTADVTAIQFLVQDTNRAVLLVVAYENAAPEEVLRTAIGSMMSLERTPFGSDDLGEVSEIQLSYWRGQFDTMSPEDRARYGNPDDAAGCVAAGLASPRITRYPAEAVDPNQVDPTNELEMSVFGNYQADIEEMLAFCGLPAGSLGTWGPGATYDSDFLDQNFEQLVQQEFPQAAANFESQGIDVPEFAEGLCTEIETIDSLDELAAASPALEPAGIFSGDEDFAEFLGFATASRCPESLQPLLDQYEGS